LGDNGPVQRVNDYGDWRVVSGLMLPFQRTVTDDGEVVSKEQTKELVVNPPVDPALFAKPNDIIQSPAGGGPQ
jgi:hypothetical protein